jgi:hypothetical protein
MLITDKLPNFPYILLSIELNTLRIHILIAEQLNNWYTVRNIRIVYRTITVSITLHNRIINFEFTELFYVFSIVVVFLGGLYVVVLIICAFE